MRWNLLKTYDKIFTIDLHGNSKKKETAPDGSADVNVFDIMQGVSINVFVKTGKKNPNELGKVFHYDLFGKREFKYDFLIENSLDTIDYNIINSICPNYYFIQTDEQLSILYQIGFSINELFAKNSSGIATARDGFTIQFTFKEIKDIVNDFVKIDIEEARKKYNLREDVRDWKVILAKEDAIKNISNNSNFSKILYRPYDFRFTFYTGKTKGFHCMPRGEIMKHFISKDNIGYIFPRQCKGESGYCHGFVSKTIIDVAAGDAHSGSGTNFFPLYLYLETNAQQTIEQNSPPLEGLGVVRTPNLNTEIVNQIAEKLDLTFTNEKETTENTFAPIDILDYIYAVLHSPTYRETYKEFLKIDFPRVPYPTDKNKFWQLVKLGGDLRQIHLLESPIVEHFITSYPIHGTNEVDKPHFQNSPPVEGCQPQDDGVVGRVFINNTQYFDNVPEVAWNFYIGGYQPAQKWLKDRKFRKLEFDDILHYQKIIVALTETDRLMKEIDKVL